MFPAILGAIIGGGMSAASAANTNETNARIARENRDWQQQMANTSHQREMADYAAAGINPIMTAGSGGAGTPSPTVPTMQDLLSPAISTAMQGLQLINAQKQIEQQDARIENETKIADAQVTKTYADVGMLNYTAEDFGKKWHQWAMQNKLTDAQTKGQHLGNTAKAIENKREMIDLMNKDEFQQFFFEPFRKGSKFIREKGPKLKDISPFANKLMDGAMGALNSAISASREMGIKTNPLQINQNSKQFPYNQ